MFILPPSEQYGRRSFYVYLTLIALTGSLITGCGSGKVVVSTSSFDFGSVAVDTHVRRIVASIANGSASPLTMSPSLSGTIQSSISRSGSCGSSLAAGETCSLVLTFSPTDSGTQSGTLALNLQGGAASGDQTIALAGTGVNLDAGQSLVAATANPLVASYSYHPTSSGQIYVEFGPTTSYGLKTATYNIPSNGTASIYVAGMRADTEYHMRASVVLEDGSTLSDADHTFTTSHFAATTLPHLSVTTNGTPQSGVELVDVIDTVNNGQLQAFATDLQGNIIWGYTYDDGDANSVIQPIKLMPNGHFLVTVSYPSNDPLDPSFANETVDVREVDLAGTPIRDISLSDLNQRLTAAGFNVPIANVHHDLLVLPNGHWILLCNTVRTLVNIGPVLGDVVVDLDNNLNPVWVWNEFDHLDINRRPTGFPDWTHSNAVLYTGDGNLLVSSRHQSWIMKVNYNNGQGDGSILWKLGQDGDFRLTNASDPGNWFAGQHQPSFVGPSTYGVFSLAMMDNGFNRNESSDTYCVTTCYTALPVMTIDEVNKTATYTFREILPAGEFSPWGGGSTPLANGDLEYDLAAEDTTNSKVMEVQPTGIGSANTVWSMQSTGDNMYRANRIPSLYPGVQW